MKLDRNLTKDGHGKYGLVLNRELKRRADEAAGAIRVNRVMSDSEIEAMKIVNAVKYLEDMGILDWGTTPETEFFVMKLKDRFAEPALHAYAYAARNHDPEYSDEVGNLAYRAGRHHPNAKTPD